MEKKYLNHLYNQSAEADGLLGSFDADKHYIIEEDIIKELINCNKLVSSREADKILAVADFDAFKLDFVIYIQDGENNLKRAGIFVKEKCNLEFKQKTLETYVDSFVYENSALFYEELKKRYKLFSVDESEGIDLKNSGFLKIINKKTASKKYKTSIPFFLDLDREYVKKMLALLRTSGPYGAELINQLRLLVEEKKLNKNAPTYWRDLKDLVDKTIIDNIGLFNKDTIDLMNKVQNEYLQAHGKTKADSTKIEEAAAAAPSKKKKPDKKPSIEAVPSVFGKGGGKGKGDNKGKDGKNKEPSSNKPAPISNKPPVENKPTPPEERVETITIETEVVVEETITEIVTPDGYKITYEMFGATYINTTERETVPEKPRTRDDGRSM